jgi:hypothetical protein
MSAQTAALMMCVVEFALWAVLSSLFWKKELHRRFPAMGVYLALHVAAMPTFIGFLYGQMFGWFTDTCATAYFYLYWVVYFAGAVLFFFVSVEVYRYVFSAFPDLLKLGSMVFRWVALASAIVSLSTFSFERPQVCVISNFAYRLMRSASILDLCLLAFICLCMKALSFPFRSTAFGITVGFGLMSINDFVLSTLMSSNVSLTDPLQFVSESVILVALGIWIAYCLRPQLKIQPGPPPAAVSLAVAWLFPRQTLQRPGAEVLVRDCK